MTSDAQDVRPHRIFSRRGAAVVAVLALAAAAGCGGAASTGTTDAGSRYAGQKIEKHLQAGWDQYKFQDEPTMSGQLAGAIRHEALQTRVGAIEAAFMYAGELGIQQRLGPNDASKLVAAMEHDFPATAPIVNKEVLWSTAQGSTPP